ncbi:MULTISPECIES: sigma-70 family RNA polymerase sigma factor [unclassified Mucilaginibacter]|uniref:RNA polymerase sigma factor n=1 Tax=unclassified Mucilaginibacter TaxID=2617802 RepID=UPI002AC8E152|nr:MULTISPECIES: sigma-70 family RNA polymerase sigma factor [unclassified Mucilaginibacter]MEB0262135.1 sigma-70 family RNA polymerase sigma factor [Mucilaginibacter sp. 10I4]MEB0279796.1 sigma-70 family RNA polymerase sigma factor [Mucilaginibacter sp. 10B2]MEB0301252.1 sigma-70 family RNA polymerase sigma factor [Mucilaginibacter sp. 5C4]WPX24232.1 sigma-70 family RNA polymerase sigma factor [Mucilaginibacter sp. 5C4]
MTAASMPQDKNSHIIQTIASYGKSLLGFIRKRVKNDADAEDILQDVWYQFSNVVNAGPIEQTSAWLYRVAKNRIIDKHKKHSETLLDDILPATGDEEEDNFDFQSILLTEPKTPETEYLRNLFWEQLFVALDELPENQRQVFIWQELDDMPFEEIAQKIGENINTLVSRKRYAVLHLRKRLKQLYKEITEY